MTYRPIADYALLSDCHGAALVSREGSVDWLCQPRFDGRSVFARLLDDAAGHWHIRPEGATWAERRYVADTMVLETTFRGVDGVSTLHDALATGVPDGVHDVGRHAPHALIRTLTCDRGTVTFEMEFAPRPEYGLIRPLVVPVAGGWASSGGPDLFALSTPVPGACADGTVRARFTLPAGQRLGFALQYAPDGTQPRVWSQRQIRWGMRDSVQAWRAWSRQHQHYRGPWAHLVAHSGRVLRALTYQPTGAVVAAPTTSLPQEVGGQRNWDYRYAWLRDASSTVEALLVAACPQEAEEFFGWLVRTAGQPGWRSAPQVMCGVGGEHDLSEHQLEHLAGWRRSRPVRVGNSAWRQTQHDVYGELLDAAHRLRPLLGPPDPTSAHLLAQVADRVAVHWAEPDHGIWAVRDTPRHFLHSKLMCWVALDRAVRLADTLRARDRMRTWAHHRELIRDAIEREGWNDDVGAFTQSFGSPALDASALLIPIVGFLPAADPRVAATVTAVRQRLTDSRGLVYRYRDSGDGLPGGEGTFLPCSFWLAHCLALAGENGQAREVFAGAANQASDVGLLSEEVDPVTGELLGNYPRALSHVALIGAADAIARGADSPTGAAARRRTPTG